MREMVSPIGPEAGRRLNDKEGNSWRHWEDLALSFLPFDENTILIRVYKIIKEHLFLLVSFIFELKQFSPNCGNCLIYFFKWIHVTDFWIINQTILVIVDNVCVFYWISLFVSHHD